MNTSPISNTAPTTIMAVLEAPAVAGRPSSRQQRLYFFPLPQTQGSFRPTVLDIVWLTKRFAVMVLSGTHVHT